MESTGIDGPWRHLASLTTLTKILSKTCDLITSKGAVRGRPGAVQSHATAQLSWAHRQHVDWKSKSVGGALFLTSCWVCCKYKCCNSTWLTLLSKFRLWIVPAICRWSMVLTGPFVSISTGNFYLFQNCTSYIPLLYMLCDGGIVSQQLLNGTSAQYSVPLMVECCNVLY